LKSVDRVRRNLCFTWALHSCAQASIRRAEESLPADVLDVRVASGGQPQAAFHPSPLQDIATIRSRHAPAETVHTHAPPYPGLISTFRCHQLTPKKTSYCGLRRTENR
jgi:hypothetical protein